ncbi:FadR/GntR family transcriptional regulator [Bacillus songklensis]|uniref:FadR/GntR family transcriptional regulator n=1 Tax=Bacillus songklensis TaxID=1069116 RepID=A0ABV8AZ04_9BACI
MMETDGLKTGDKIPSERELSERLNVGRSSVREALRAIELLGIIETRRGEGTFIKEIGEHQLIELLATFLLQDSKAKKDLIETKFWIEQIGLKIAFYRLTDSQLQHLQTKVLDEPNYEYLVKELFQYIDNRLLLRIWRVVEGYFKTFEHTYPTYGREILKELFEAMINRDEQRALTIHRQYYETLIKMENVE